MYITLTSAANLDSYPLNNGGDFTVQLREPLHLNSNYEVALAQILYRKNWATLQADQNFIILEHITDIENRLKQHLLWQWLNVELSKLWQSRNLFMYLKSNANRKSFIHMPAEMTHLNLLNTLNMATQRLLVPTTTTAKLSSFWKVISDQKLIKFSTKNLLKDEDIKSGDQLVLSDDLVKLLSNDRPIALSSSTEWSISNKYFFENWSTAKVLETSDITRTLISLPTKHYSSEVEVIATLNHEMEKHAPNLSIIMNDMKHSHFVLKANSLDYTIWFRIHLSIALAEVLGFSRDQLDHGHYLKTADIINDPINKINSLLPTKYELGNVFVFESSQEVGIQRITEALWIHCNIVQAQAVGDTWKPLLHIVPSIGGKNETTELNFNPPHYIPLSLYHINSIRIQIFNTYGAQTIPFQSDVIIKLHIRERTTSLS